MPASACPQQEHRLRAGAAAARGFRPPRGSASCSNTRARYIHVPLGRNSLAATSFATVVFPASASHCLRPAGAGFNEATDMQVAKVAVVRGSGASRPWMACARLLAPWTADSGDAHDPRTTAAPLEARRLRRLFGKRLAMGRANRHNSASAAGWSSLAARRAHNPKVAGSNPAPATMFGGSVFQASSGRRQPQSLGLQWHLFRPLHRFQHHRMGSPGGPPVGHGARSGPLSFPGPGKPRSPLSFRD